MAGARVGEAPRVLEVIEDMKRAAGVDFDVESASRREGDPAASAWARKVKIYTRALGLLG